MNASDFAAIVKDAGVRLVVLGVLLRQTSSLIPDADMAGARDALERCVERKKPEH